MSRPASQFVNKLHNINANDHVAALQISTQEAPETQALEVAHLLGGMTTDPRECKALPTQKFVE